MKRCPQCHRVETDEALKFCRVDGATLVDDSHLGEWNAPTCFAAQDSSEVHTSILPHRTDANINRGTAPTSVLPPEQAASTTGQLVKPKPRRTFILSLAASAIVITLIIGGYFFFTRNRTTTIESIAVLPFENRSGSADADYLSDGLAESLIYRLSQLPNLKVSPTSSVLRYKGKEVDAQKIGSELGVSAVMSGRMVQRGDNLTISVELVDARTNKLIWGEQYERKMSDLLATQREIATAITEKLQLKLSGDDAKGITKKYTNSNEAYQLYLKGRFYWNKRTADGLKQAAEFYKQAIESDPSFALAYSGLAETYVLFPNYSVAAPKDSMPLSKAAALKHLNSMIQSPKRTQPSEPT
jgi:TolB-like protein